MKKWRYLEASNKVLSDLDMLEESFVLPDELAGFFNEAVESAEADIHRLSLEEDYFLTKLPITLVSGQANYPMPDNIYNRDIRRIMFADGSNIYPVRRIRGQNKFEKITYAQQEASSDEYRYFLENDPTSSEDEIILVPPSRDAGDELMTMWFIRCARRIPLPSEGSQDATDATIIDIPTFINFIFAYVKVKIMEKAKEPLDSYMLDLQTKRQMMADTLSGFRDDDDVIMPDLRAYSEAT